jgi:putative transposase
MAKPRMDLSAFVGKLLDEQDGDVLREGSRVLSQALMETEVAGVIGADRHERTPERSWPSCRKPMCTASRRGRSTSLMKALGLDGVSKSEVSRICGELDPLVEAFRTRALPTDYRTSGSMRPTTRCGSTGA